MQSKTIINLLSNENSRHFIREHIKDSVETLALSARKYPEIDIKASAQLISLYQKAKIKLPEHYKLLAAFNAKSYEQCSSERVAEFKSRFMEVSGKQIINLSGGLGVDDIAFSHLAKKVESCETDIEIHNLAVFNKQLFACSNLNRIFGDGIEYTIQHEKVDIIYADPDRRPGASKVFRLEDCQPDILANVKMLHGKTEELWLKLSPMADLSYLEKSLPNISKIAVIGWQEEVKELLVCCKNVASPKSIEKFAIRLTPTSDQIFKGGEELIVSSFNNDGVYLFEPDKTIIKAGLSANYANSLGLSILGPQTHFYVSDQYRNNFQGRVFEIVEKMAYKPRIISAYLKDNKIDRADITIRNFRETTAEIRERFKLKQTGGHYLCFANDHTKQSWMYHLRQLKD